MDSWCHKSNDFSVPADDPEVTKEVKVNAVSSRPEHSLNTLIERVSSWYKQKRILSLVLRFIKKCQKKQISSEINVSDMEDAEIILLRFIQENISPKKETELSMVNQPSLQPYQN